MKRIPLGLGGILTIIFVLAKVFGAQVPNPVASWSWLWVFAPLWLPLAVYLAYLAIVLVISGIIMLLTLAVAMYLDWKDSK